MVTMEEVNQALLDAWTQDLKKQESLPIKIARGYKKWVQEQIKAAAASLQEQDSATQSQEGSGESEAPQE